MVLSIYTRLYIAVWERVGLRVNLRASSLGSSIFDLNPPMVVYIFTRLTHHAYKVANCNSGLPVVGCEIPWKDNSLISRQIGDFSIYPARACLFSGKPGESFWINPIFLSGALVLINRRVNSGEPGETGTGGGCDKYEKSASFLFEVSCSQRRVPDLPTTNPNLFTWRAE